MSEEIRTEAFEAKKQLFDSLLTEQVAASCNAENPSILGLSLLLSTVFEQFNNLLQKPCPKCIETEEKLLRLEDDLLEAQNEVKRQNARFKKARRRNLDDEDRIDVLKAELARVKRQDSRNISFDKSVAKRSRETITDSDATDDELVPVRIQRRVKRSARMRRVNSPDSTDFATSQSPTVGESESARNQSPSTVISRASPTKNGMSPPRNGLPLDRTSPQHVPDTYATQVFAPELQAPPGVVIPETFPMEDCMDEIVPVTPDLPSSSYLKSSLAKRQLVTKTESKPLSSKSDRSAGSKKSNSTVETVYPDKKPKSKTKSLSPKASTSQATEELIATTKSLEAKQSCGPEVVAPARTPEKRSPSRSPPKSPVIGRALRPDRSRLRLTTGMEGVRAHRTEKWVKRTSGGDSTSEWSGAVSPTETSLVPYCSPGKCSRVVGGVRIALDTESISLDEGRMVLESGEDVRVKVQCGPKSVTLEKKPDLEESVSIMASNSTVSVISQSTDRRVADGWSLKPARSLREHSTKGKDRPLQQMQLGLFVRPKVTDISTLPEFNGGVRVSQTAKSPAKDASKRPKKSPPILDEPDVPETSQDCFNRGVSISSTMQPDVKQSANLNGSFPPVSQMPKDDDSKAKSPRKAQPGRKDQKEENDPELLMELMNQPEPVSKNALQPIKPEGPAQKETKALVVKQPITKEVLELFADYDKVPNRHHDEPNYKYKNDVVRKKSERDKLQGWACSDCKKWWDACPGTEEERQRQMNRCSKHRGKFQPPDTPPGYWDLKFPTTQEMKDRGMMSETMVASPRLPKPARRKKLL